MPLTQDQIQRLSILSALKNDSDLSIDSVVDSLRTLESLKLEASLTPSRSGNPTLILRNDVPQEDASMPDMLLACSPQRVRAHQIVLEGIMQGE